MEFSLLNLLLVLLVAAIGGAIASRLGYPSLMGELAAGMIFGPALLGVIHASEGLQLLAEVGVFLMMLYIGIEVDHRDLMKASWAGLLAAIGGFVVPFAAGYWLVSIHYHYPAATGLFIGLAMGVTSLATKSRVLMELKLLGTRVANVILAGALVCDTVALVVFAGIAGFAESESADLAHVAWVLIKALLFFCVTIVIGLRVFPLIGKLFRRFGFTERSMNFTLVILIGLVFAELAEIAGLHSIIGAFIAGLFIREEVLQRKLSHEVSGMVHDVSLGFLAPVFFVSAGFNVDIGVLWSDTRLLAIAVGVALVAKIVGAWLFYLPMRAGWREGVVIGAGMNGGGAVLIIIAEIGLEMGLIDPSMFSILVFMAFFTTALEPVFLKAGTAWLRRHGQLARADDRRDLVMIAGASPVARLLARELAKSERVVMMDNNANLCQAATAEGLNAIQGNVLNEDLLDVAGASNARIFLSLTANHEVNRLATQRARDMFGVPQVWMWPQMGIPSMPILEKQAEATDPGDRAPAQTAQWNEWITRREVEPASVAMAHAVPQTNFTSIMIDCNLLPLVVEREGRRLPAMVVDELRAGDVVVGLRRVRHAEYHQDVFEQLIRNCPILDMEATVAADVFFERAGEALAGLVGRTTADIAALLARREEESSTVVAPGVAIPHIIVDGDQPVALLLARCREGVVFPRHDGPPVQFVFVIVGARSARNLHLRILSAIAQLFQDPAFEDIMLAAPDIESMRRIVLNTRRHRF